ncbi:MAG: NAD(P)/FAD-dependent oxidoreductase [Aestuariivirgaceae bacterium]|nr:NAD(P)/FAD-dependent oxidoreductase [Aestuariivirgaceae bacterium]
MEGADVIIIGAGAAGLMCAIEAGKRGKSVLVIDHARAAGEKIRISGGGRCNFTNVNTSPKAFISENPHFAISALRRYTPADFVKLVDKHGIAWHEKKRGQLFCDGSSRQIVDMLLTECREAGVRLMLETAVGVHGKNDEGFVLSIKGQPARCTSLVIATGGPSIPKMGATGWGYDVARYFNLPIVEPRAALVPFMLQGEWLERASQLAGLSTETRSSCAGAAFEEAMLFTHRGLSGPAMLQVSSYWREGEPVVINLLPGLDAFALLKERKVAQPRQDVATALAEWLPKRFVNVLTEAFSIEGKLADLSHEKLKRVADALHQWQIVPSGTEGYRTAEVTRGGVDTTALSSRTMEANAVPGLYFIGEVLDVTGWLGGYNFQWAWASGFAAGQAVT